MHHVMISSGKFLQSVPVSREEAVLDVSLDLSGFKELCPHSEVGASTRYDYGPLCSLLGDEGSQSKELYFFVFHRGKQMQNQEMSRML